MRKYPAQMSLTAWISFIGGAQSAVFAFLVQHEPGVWSVKMFGIDFWAITYCVSNFIAITAVYTHIYIYFKFKSKAC